MLLMLQLIILQDEIVIPPVPFVFPILEFLQVRSLICPPKDKELILHLSIIAFSVLQELYPK